MSSHSIGRLIILKRDVVRVTWPIFNFDARNHIFGTAKARVAEFYSQVVLALG